MNVTEMRAEYARLYSEPKQVLEFSKDRELTDSETKENEKRFARMDELQALMSKQEQDAKAAFEKGRVQMPVKSKDQIAYEISEGRYTGGFASAFHDPVRFLTPRDSFAAAFSIDSATGTGGMGLGDYCRAMVCGPKNEQQRFSLAAGTDSAGGYTVPTWLSAQVIDRLREGSIFVNAGAVTIPLESHQNRIVRIGNDPAPAWKAENAAVAESEMTFEGVTFQPHTLAVIVKASRELLEDALNCNQAIETAFAGAFAAELDRACGWGAGENDEPTGIVNTDNVLTVDPNDADGDTITSYAKFLTALYSLQANNAVPNGVVISPRDMLAVNLLADNTGQPLRRPDALTTIPFHVSSKVPVAESYGASEDASSIIMGDFSKLWIGVRNGLRIEVLRDGQYGANLQYAFLGYLRADVAVTHAKAFCRIQGIVPYASSDSSDESFSSSSSSSSGE